MKHLTRRDFIKSALAAGVALDIALHHGTALAQSPKHKPGRRNGFCFLHTYESTGRYWRGIEKAGLIRPTTGVRLVNSPWGEDSRRFNTVARAGGDLHRIIKRRKPYLVVDRVAGGSPYCPYAFDQDLIADYASLLGDKLLGGQVHETVSNVHSEWRRLKKAAPECDSKPIDPDALRGYFDWSSALHWLQYGMLEDYRGRLHPKSEKDFWKEIVRALHRQGGRFGGHYCYCESTRWGELGWHLFYKLGAPWCIVEVGGHASVNTQFAVASLRGAAKAAGKPWGVFYAPWGPVGCTSFINVADWSWQASRQSLDASNWPVGPEKGPSSALQRRAFFHAFLSGAHTLHEEWGAEGNLLNWDEGKLSSYGQVTRELLDFQDSHPDVGEPHTPIALTLDAQEAPLNKTPWDELKNACSVTRKPTTETPHGKIPVKPKPRAMVPAPSRKYSTSSPPMRRPRSSPNTKQLFLSLPRNPWMPYGIGCQKPRKN